MFESPTLNQALTGYTKHSYEKPQNFFLKKGLIYPQGSAGVHNLLDRKFVLLVEHLAFILQRPIWKIVWRTSLYIEN